MMKYHVRLTSEQWHEMYYRIPEHNQHTGFDKYYNCETDEIKCLNTDGTDHYLVFETEKDAIMWVLKYL